MSELIEHPNHPGVFYDALMVYIPSGDAMEDLIHKMKAIEAGRFPIYITAGENE